MNVRKGMKGMIRSIKYKLLYGLIVIIIELSNAMPRRLWLFLCTVIGNIMYCVVPGIKRQICKNLTNAYKGEKSEREIRELTKQVVVMLVKNTGVVLREFLISRDHFYQQTIVRGAEHAEAAFLRGRGVIFLT